MAEWFDRFMLALSRHVTQPARAPVAVLGVLDGNRWAFVRLENVRVNPMRSDEGAPYNGASIVAQRMYPPQTAVDGLGSTDDLSVLKDMLQTRYVNEQWHRVIDAFAFWRRMFEDPESLFPERYKAPPRRSQLDEEDG